MEYETKRKAAANRGLAAIERGDRIVAAAEAANREVTPAEAAEVKKLLKDAERAALAAQVAKLGEELESPVGSRELGTGQTLGDAFITSDGYRNLIESGIPGTSSWSTGEIDVYSAAGDPVLKSTGTNADAIAQQVVPGLFDPGLRQERLTLAALFSQENATGGTIRYMKATTRNAPTDAATTEGEDKPGAEFGFDDATAQLEKLAAFIPVSEEMLEDSVAVRNYINTHLPLMVEQSLEAKLATALYAGAGLTAAPATLTGGGNGFDAVAAGIKELQTNDFFEPDGLFIHPDDYWALRIDKNAQDDYLGNGPWAPASSGPWGLRTVVSTSATAGSPIVGAFRQGGAVWRRGATRLEASNSHSDYFRKNLVAIRAELRYALTIYFAEAFCVVDVTGS